MKYVITKGGYNFKRQIFSPIMDCIIFSLLLFVEITGATKFPILALTAYLIYSNIILVIGIIQFIYSNITNSFSINLVNKDKNLFRIGYPYWIAVINAITIILVIASISIPIFFQKYYALSSFTIPLLISIFECMYLLCTILFLFTIHHIFKLSFKEFYIETLIKDDYNKHILDEYRELCEFNLMEGATYKNSYKLRKAYINQIYKRLW